MIPDRVGHIHANRRARALERAAMRDAAAALAPAVIAIARQYGCAPSTVAKIAVAACGSGRA